MAAIISDTLPFGRLRYGEPNAISNAIGYAMHRSRSHHAVIRVYDSAGNVIETHEHPPSPMVPGKKGLKGFRLIMAQNVELSPINYLWLKARPNSSQPEGWGRTRR
jgi:hypothetical protein